MNRFSLIAFSLLALSAHSVIAKGPTFTDPNKADKDFAVQGEYTGLIDIGEDDLDIGLQLIANGKGKFTSVAFVGGLPGEGWNTDYPSERVEATLANGEMKIEGTQAVGHYKDGTIKLETYDGNELGVLRRVIRKSPTLGKKPPEGAIVLFDGKSTDQWKKAKMTDSGLLMQGTTSKPTFQSHQLHIEFLIPYMPEDKAQGRGNSGIYLQGRYEVQMLDSFGLSGEQNECGGIYSIKKPDTNMCYPPLSWQTYDIDFQAGQFDADGKAIEPAKMTVKHNGEVIHKDVKLPKSTTASPLKPGAEPGPIYLQDHGCPVRYRNIWVVKTEA